MELAMLLDCLAVALGGALGSVCRYLLSLVSFAQVGNAGFPAATLLTNVVGAFAIGVVAGLAGAQAGLDARTTLLLKTGVCGGFTTFSTFALESIGLIGRGETLAAGAYMVLSCALGMAAALAGQAVAARFA